MTAKTTNYQLLLKLSPLLILLLGMLLWQYAFWSTWDTLQSYERLKETSLADGKWSVSPSYTQKRMEQIRKQYGRFEIDTLSWKNRLWGECASLAERDELELKSFPPYGKGKIADKPVYFQQVVISGGYVGLMRMQYSLDTAKGIGRITSLSYHKHPRTQELTLSLVFTGIQKGSDEQ